jgi:pimeloyl-ACP methyl ester carboxylesterase
LARRVKSEYASVNGVKLHYVRAGSGPLMLFVHGFPEFWYAWHEQLAEFSRDHLAVAPDLRGFNLSDKPKDVKQYRAHVIVEDLRQLIGHLGHDKAVVIAHDWGGAAAWNLAAQHPEVVEKLVIVNSPHPITFARELVNNPAQAKASDYMLLFRDPKAERVMAENNYARMVGMLRDWLRSARPPDAATLDRYREAWAQPGALTGGLNYYRTSPLYPPSPAGPGADALKLDPAQFTVRVPTLVIWGEKDPALLPGLLDGLDQCIPDLRIERIAEGSHWVVHEFPEQVNRLIREFVGAAA